MPLVVMCGYPCSGKSTRAGELVDYLKKRDLRCTLIDEDFLSANTATSKILDKNEIYTDSGKEKDLRGMVRAAVEKHLSKDNIVVCDFHNYIKGFRYELYCIARSLRSTYCVICCDTSVDHIKEWNRKAPSKRSYEESVIDALVMRFEPPNDSQRWDSPLFNILYDDSLPAEEIYNALKAVKAKPQHSATINVGVASSDFQQDLDKITQEVITCILDGQKQGMSDVIIPNPMGDGNKAGKKNDRIVVHLCKHVTMSELRRIRRQFVSFTKLHNDNNSSRICPMFVDFINNSLT